MRKPATYLDFFQQVHQAGNQTNVSWETLPMLKGFFGKLGGPLLSDFIFYILDFTQGKYLAVGPGLETFLGYNANYLRDGGPLDYFEHWHRNDWQMYNSQVFSDHRSIVEKAGAETCRNLLIRSNYRIKNKDGAFLTLSQQSSYIDVSPDGIPLAVMGWLRI